MNPKLTTTYFKVLEAIYDNLTVVGNNIYCPLGQNELAIIVNCNRVTVGAIIKELKKDNYIVCDNVRSKYQLTELGIQTVKKSKEIK